VSNQPPPSGPKLTYVNRPEIAETFADSLENVMLDGSVIRLEFVVNRMDAPMPPAPPTGTKMTSCRIVMPLQALFQVTDKLRLIIAALQQQGLIKPVTQPETAGKPN
jgi:hypothetical protein